MKNLKGEKGITLVALIITIIVLLILAVVTISAVNEGSLFSYANNAATSYSKSQEDENTMIASYLTEIRKNDESASDKNAENDISHPSMVEGTTWSNVGIAQNLSMPQHNAYYISIGSDELEYNNGLIENDFGKYPGVGLKVGEYEYIYSWGDYTFEDEGETISIHTGWQVNPYAENQSAPDISTIRLNGMIAFTDGDKTWLPATECTEWFIQY